MAAAEGNNIGGRRQRAVRGRRNWSNDEEEVLLACLKELVATGWKSDNGFRPGYINKLEEAMCVRYPRANIKATLHITSKLTGWKKNYGSLVYILSRSRVGFNVYGDFTVDCDNETWDHIFNVDSNAVNIRGKSWPYLDRWMDVFGKDRATGESAEDVMEAVNELLVEDNLNEVDIGHTDASMDTNYNTATDTDYHTTTEDTEARRDAIPTRISKKRKTADNTDKVLCDLLGQMQRDTNSRLESISTKIGYAADLGNTKKEIFNLLADIPQLSLDARFDACDILVDNPKRMEFFIGLPEAACPAYVYRLLHGKPM